MSSATVFRQLVRPVASRFTSRSTSSIIARYASTTTSSPASNSARRPTTSPASSFATSASPYASSAPSSSSSAGAYPTNPFVNYPNVYGGFKVHKSRAALTIAFARPQVSIVAPRSPTAQPYYRLERAGSLLLDFAPAAADTPDTPAGGATTRVYDWRNKVTVFLSVTEIGDLLAFHHTATQSDLKFYHDPAMGTDHAGDIRKELIIKRAGAGKGYYVNLGVTSKAAGKSSIQVPVSEGEMAVVVGLCQQMLPQLLCMQHLPPKIQIEETSEGQLF